MEETSKNKVEMVAHEAPVVEPFDDREEVVDVTFGPAPREYVTERLTKGEAFQRLYDYYNGNSQTQMVPRADANGRPVNMATVYCKMTYTDGIGEKVTIVKDLPLWIMAERAITHRHRLVEIITKAEHDKFYRERDREQNSWRVQSEAEKIRIKNEAEKEANILVKEGA